MFNMSNVSSKMMDRFFRRVDNVVWDLMTGRVGIKGSEGITTLEGTGDDAQVVINMFDQFGMEVPAFAQNTPVDSLAPGDLIFNGKSVLGWVIEKTDKGNLTVMSTNGTRHSWKPPKVSLLGFDSGVMVLRSLVNMLPGGTGGLGTMQGMLMPMLMMGGDSLDLDSMMPLLLMSQVGTGDGSANPLAGANMGNMMQMMMLMSMMRGGKSESGGTGAKMTDSFFDRVRK